MPHHPALAPGRAAVITGAASGIGLAMAERCVALGMKVCMADVDEAALRAAVGLLAAKAANQADVFAILIDVSRREEVERCRITPSMRLARCHF